MAGSEFQVVRPDTEKLRDPHHDGRERKILMSRRKHDRRHERPDAVDTRMHMSMRYDGAVRRRHLLTNVLSLNRIRCRTGRQWRSWRMVLAMWSNLRLPVISSAVCLWCGV